MRAQEFFNKYRVLLVGIALVALITACSDPRRGTAVPGSTTPITESASTKPSSARPREIKLDGKDPCQLLTAEQLPALKIDEPGQPGYAPTFHAKQCSWTVTGADSRLAPVTAEGINVWTGGERTGQAEKTAPIAEFPTIAVTIPSDKHRCDVMVDVADGQYLLATFSVSPSFEDRFPKPCDGARQVAEAAMQNLLTSAPPSSARPREIRLDGKDPCQLLTSAQLATLKFDRPGKLEDATVFKAKGCVWAISGPDARVLPVTSEGIEVWSNGKRTGRPEEIDPVAGFPAITVRLPSDLRRCDVIVDTAQGQYLMVTYSLTPGFEDRFPPPCNGARQVAEAVMQNLVK